MERLQTVIFAKSPCNLLHLCISMFENTVQISNLIDLSEDPSSSFIHLWQMFAVAVATVCILLACGFEQQRASGSWTPAIKKKRESHVLLSDLFDGQKVGSLEWPDSQEKASGEWGSTFSFLSFLSLRTNTLNLHTWAGCTAGYLFSVFRKEQFIEESAIRIKRKVFKGCLHDTGVRDFRAGASSLRFPLMALYLFTWYHHKMSCRRESPRRELTPRLLYWGENFTSVRNLATVSCKGEATTRFGVKSVCR